MSTQFKFNWSQFKFLNLILNCIEKKNRGTSSIQLNFLIHQLTVYDPLFLLKRNTVDSLGLYCMWKSFFVFDFTSDPFQTLICENLLQILQLYGILKESGAKNQIG